MPYYYELPSNDRDFKFDMSLYETWKYQTLYAGQDYLVWQPATNSHINQFEWHIPFSTSEGLQAWYDILDDTHWRVRYCVDLQIISHSEGIVCGIRQEEIDFDRTKATEEWVNKEFILWIQTPVAATGTYEVKFQISPTDGVEGDTTVFSVYFRVVKYDDSEFGIVHYDKTKFGLMAKNEQGRVIVTDRMKSLFFVGKALYLETVSSSEVNDGFRVWSYEINSVDPPLPFVAAGETLVNVSYIEDLGQGTWHIEVMAKTKADPFEVYCFAPMSSANTLSNTKYGLQVFNYLGETTFDSRYAPLVIVGGGDASPPDDPISYPNYSATLGDLSSWQCDSETTASMVYDFRNGLGTECGSYSAKKPILYYPAHARTTRMNTLTDEDSDCSGISGYFGGCYGVNKEMASQSNYWAQYRSAVRAVAGKVYCDWLPERIGCHWFYEESVALFGNDTGLATMRDDGEGGEEISVRRKDESIDQYWRKLVQVNETLNIEPTGYLVSDGALYD